MRVELHRGWDRRIATTVQMQATLHGKAEQVAAEARRIVAPVSQRVTDGIEATAGVDDRGRMVGRVNAHHWTSWFVEAGTVDQRPTAYLRKALENVLGNVRRGV
jgi:hypothetical protein